MDFGRAARLVGIRMQMFFLGLPSMHGHSDPYSFFHGCSLGVQAAIWLGPMPSTKTLVPKTYTADRCALTQQEQHKLQLGGHVMLFFHKSGQPFNGAPSERANHQQLGQLCHRLGGGTLPSKYRKLVEP